MGLINADNVEPREVDVAALEEQWFNNPDLYNLAETERVDEALQTTIIRTSQRFDITDHVKLNNPNLIALIKNVDDVGPGAAVQAAAAPTEAAIVGKPGEWSVDSFL
jgi:hypothetical protein